MKYKNSLQTNNKQSLRHYDRGSLITCEVIKMDNNELYHYGVKGMKWGIQKIDKNTIRRKAERTEQLQVRMAKSTSILLLPLNHLKDKNNQTLEIYYELSKKVKYEPVTLQNTKLMGTVPSNTLLINNLISNKQISLYVTLIGQHHWEYLEEQIHLCLDSS